MKAYRNQQGLTLVELLGALTLLFIIAGLVFATLSNSLQLFQGEGNRINIRQEVNTIANQLTTFYQKNADFTIIQVEDGIRIESEREDGVVEAREHFLSGHKITVFYTDRETERFQKREITITVTGNEDFTLHTVASRLKGDT